MSKSEPVAEIEPGDGSGLRFRLHEDWTWRRAPGTRSARRLGDYPASAAIREPGGVEIRTVRSRSSAANRPALSAARIVTEWQEGLERRDAAGD